MSLPLLHSNDAAALTVPSGTPDGWLSTERVAQLLGVTERTIRRQCQSGELTARRVETATGAAWLVCPTSRPQLMIAAAPESPVLAIAGQAGGLAGLPADQRTKVHARMQQVEQFTASLEEKPIGMRQGEWLEHWVAAWNLRHIDDKLTAKTLRLRVSAFQKRGLAGLVDGRFANGRTETLSADAGAGKLILGLWLNENRPSLPRIYEVTCAIAKREGWQVPSLRACQAWLSRQDNKLKLAGRDPAKFRRRCIPYISRDSLAVPAQACIVGDHHQFDFFWPRYAWVADKKHPRGGYCDWKFFRPWLTGWLDFRTWYCYGAAIAFDSPDGDRVMGSFLGAVMSHGLPDGGVDERGERRRGMLYLDNGKDYRMYKFAGGRKGRQPASKGETICAEKHLQPLLDLLGVDIRWAIPFNPNAKPIESWFKIVEENFSKAAQTYCGNKPERRPERIKGLHGRAAQFAKALLGEEQFRRVEALAGKGDQELRDAVLLRPLKAVFFRWLHEDYHLRPSPARGAAGLSPQEAFARFKAPGFECRRPAERDLALLLMPNQAVSVRQNGVWVNGFCDWYWSNSLESYRCNNRKVIVSFNPDDPSRVFVYEAGKGGKRDQFICVAEPYCGSGIKPYAANAEQQEELSNAMALQRRLAREMRQETRGYRHFSFEMMLGVQQWAAGELGLLEQPAAGNAKPETPNVTLKLVGAVSQAAQAAEHHSARRALPVGLDAATMMAQQEDERESDAPRRELPDALEMLATYKGSNDEHDTDFDTA